jgi:hypothetical protein
MDKETNPKQWRTIQNWVNFTNKSGRSKQMDDMRMESWDSKDWK